MCLLKVLWFAFSCLKVENIHIHHLLVHLNSFRFKPQYWFEHTAEGVELALECRGGYVTNMATLSSCYKSIWKLIANSYLHLSPLSFI